MLAESIGCPPELGDKKVGFWRWGVGGLPVLLHSPWLIIFKSRFDAPGLNESRDILPRDQHPAGGNFGHLNSGSQSTPSCPMPHFTGWETEGGAWFKVTRLIQGDETRVWIFSSLL